jgi:hypothetical protein
MGQFVWIGGSGCLLPFLILANLLFGKLIFSSTRLWLGVEAGLVLLFIINLNIMARKISRQFSSSGRGQQSRGQQEKVIDIQGQVVEDDKRLK